MMEITRIVTGQIEENCYILHQNNEGLIVDPGADGEVIIHKVEALKIKPLAVLLTHCHFDHIGALEQVRNHFKIPVYVSPLEQEWLGNPAHNLSANQPVSVIAQPAEFEFSIGKLTIGSFHFEVVPTPGHSIGSVSFIFEKTAVVGDALFKGSIGRTDLYTGDFETLIHSIQTELFSLPDETIVYSGHGEQTTIGAEKISNPYFNK